MISKVILECLNVVSLQREFGLMLLRCAVQWYQQNIYNRMARDSAALLPCHSSRPVPAAGGNVAGGDTARQSSRWTGAGVKKIFLSYSKEHNTSLNKYTLLSISHIHLISLSVMRMEQSGIVIQIPSSNLGRFIWSYCGFLYSLLW